MLNVGEYTSPMDTCMASATYSVNPSLSRSKKKSAEKKKKRRRSGNAKPRSRPRLRSVRAPSARLSTSGPYKARHRNGPPPVTGRLSLQPKNKESGYI